MQEDSMFSDSGRHFGTTPWTDVLDADALTADERTQRLAFLAERYWRPVYHFIRRNGRSSVDASDLTQSFFMMMLRTDFVAKANPEKGRLRAYLMTALTRFLSKEYQHERSAAASFPRETLFVARIEDEVLPPDESITPQEEFDRQWARTVLNNVLGHLEQHCEQENEQLAFEVFTRRLFGGEMSRYGANKALSQELGVEQAQVENAYRKCIRWYRALFRQEIRASVSSEVEVQEEVQDLWKALE